MAAEDFQARNQPHDYGKVSEFLTASEHPRFCTVTTFLEMTNSFEDRLTPGEAVATDYMGRFQRKNKEVIAYKRFADFANLLPRHLEVVAVCVDFEGGIIRAVETGGGNEEYVSTNGGKEEKGDKGGHLVRGCTPPFAESPSLVVKTVTSPAFWLVKRTVKSHENGKPSANVSLDEHGATLLSLIKSTWITKDPDAHLKATRTLERYVLLNCCAKINGRMNRGDQNKRHFMKRMTFPTNDLNSAIVVSRVKITVGINEKPLSAEERDAVKYIIKALEREEITQDELAPLKTALTSEDPIYYNDENRLVFHTLMSKLISNTWEALDRLRRLKSETQKEYLARPEDLPREAWLKSFEEKVFNLNLATTKSVGWMTALNILKEDHGLRRILFKHLVWLQDIFSLPSLSEECDAASSSALSRAPGPLSDCSSHSRGPRSDFTEDVIDDIDNADPNDYPYASDFDQIDIVIHQQSWAEGALKFLDLVCLHTTAMHSLARFNLMREDFHIQTFLERASFQWIRHIQDSADKEMMSLDTLFKSLKKYNGRKLSTEEVGSLKSWLKKHATKPNSEGDTWVEDTNFKGNFHCEMLLISHHLLAQNRERFVESQAPQPQDRPEFLILPSKDITDRLSYKLKALPVSKRCCPACYELIQYMIQQQGNDILYPGWHSTWSAVTLPPWISRAAGLHVIAAAEIKLNERVTRILDRVERDKSDSSLGTNAGSTSTKEVSLGAPAWAYDGVWLQKYRDENPSDESSSGDFGEQSGDKCPTGANEEQPGDKALTGNVAAHRGEKRARSSSDHIPSRPAKMEKEDEPETGPGRG
jgi:hypothetical protein